MSETVALTILGLMTLVLNYTNILLVFPRRFNSMVSICLPILFTAVFYTILLYSGTMNNFYGGFRGFVHLPLMMILIRGQFFQKFFGIIFQVLLVGFQIAAAKVLAETFAPAKSEQAYMLIVIFSFISFTVYVFLVAKFGRQFMLKLFAGARWQEWALYSFGVLISFAVFAVTIETVTSTWIYILLMVFILWSFFILCFAIINTHEKAKQRYDAEFAGNIISSGREHYQKMNEMYDALCILRHDFKYHLNVVRKALHSGNTAGIDKYLDSVEAQLSENELSIYCKNPVINALLASYAERCAKLDIKYDVKIALPETLSIPNYEMCIILGNLLENALEACQKVNGGRVAELSVKTQGEQLAVMVRNSFDGVVTEENGQPVSAKKDGGFGLKSVQAVAARYGGYMLAKWDGTIFTTYVLAKI